MTSGAGTIELSLPDSFDKKKRNLLLVSAFLIILNASNANDTVKIPGLDLSVDAPTALIFAALVSCYCCFEFWVEHKMAKVLNSQFVAPASRGEIESKINQTLSNLVRLDRLSRNIRQISLSKCEDFAPDDTNDPPNNILYSFWQTKREELSSYISSVQNEIYQFGRSFINEDSAPDSKENFAKMAINFREQKQISFDEKISDYLLKMSADWDDLVNLHKNHQISAQKIKIESLEKSITEYNDQIKIIKNLNKNSTIKKLVMGR